MSFDIRKDHTWSGRVKGSEAWTPEHEDVLRLAEEGDTLPDMAVKMTKTVAQIRSRVAKLKLMLKHAGDRLKSIPKFEKRVGMWL